MTGALLDSSALLAMILGEPGHAAVIAELPRCRMASVNYGEAVSALVNRGWTAQEAKVIVEGFAIDVEPVVKADGTLAGEWRAITRHLGLSIGDRLCLAVARRLGMAVLTADRSWAELKLGVPVIAIR